jgi:retron-type reverse transcriptase
MVSFDVMSLFTIVPIVDSLELLSHHFEDDVLPFFKHALTSTYFCFDGQFYEQTDGVAMGSPLSPVIANFFVEYYEKKEVEQATHKPVCCFRYVDDNFRHLAPWPRKTDRIFLPPQWTPQKRYSLHWKKKKTTFHSWILTSTEKRTAP